MCLDFRPTGAPFKNTFPFFCIYVMVPLDNKLSPVPQKPESLGFRLDSVFNVKYNTDILLMFSCLLIWNIAPPQNMNIRKYPELIPKLSRP